MSMADLPPSSRPREKLLERGPESLSDAELLALLLRTGVAGTGVLQLADSLLQRFGGISGLLQQDASALQSVKGLGPAKRAELAAVLELARRAIEQPMAERPVLNDPGSVQRLLRLRLAHKPHEVFAVLFLDAQLRLIALEELFRGSLTHTAVHPREVVVRALALHAHAVVLAHNHPSGVCEPSGDDRRLTERLAAALHLVDVRVLDHVVVGQGTCRSLAEMGWI
ncbi:RadC family protein [Inhella crocodyli]|uniref:JAB domain-containing protein n=1 Tax=Inhella crocodyli TaxID=2499851 RepID=A0A437LSB1_9BURK|nr:DNA repair protein RadC [Inhella crocodyli]RVT88274.1 JAB domain-containing protein [Inhella crocodyli]